MHGGRRSAAEIEAICKGLGSLGGIEVLICPPFHLLGELIKIRGNSSLKMGAQDCHPQPQGAFTGDISAKMLAELGVQAVICGHSERRTAYGESNALVKKKAQAALAAGLEPIICVGESQEDYEKGRTLEVLEAQVSESIPESREGWTLAYEPVWAIGTGIAASSTDIQKAHEHILSLISAPVLYGGSVNPQNAAEIAKVKGVGGFLIGSASLKANSFLSIIEQCKPLYL